MITGFLLLALKSLLVAAVTLGLLRLTAHRSAAERSTIAHLGLFALVALPLASLALPPLSIALPAAPIAASTPAIAPVAPTPADAALLAVSAQTASTNWADTAASWAEAIGPYAYLLPALALLLLTGVALTRLVALRARAQVLVEPSWLGALARAQHRMGFKSGTALLTSDDLASPISWGLMRPTILLNTAALDATDQAEAIIAHELAHVIQRDWAKLMLARVATAAFWFNPLAWVLAREAHQLREEAADDAVLAANIAGPDYAQLLVGIARHEARTFLLTAHGVAPSRNSLRRRIARVLDANPARQIARPSWVAGFATGMLVMATPLAAVTIARSAPQAEPVVDVASAQPHVVPTSSARPVTPAAVAQRAANHASPAGSAASGIATPALDKRERRDASADPASPVDGARLGQEIANAVTSRFKGWPWQPGPQGTAHAAPVPAAAPVGPHDPVDVDMLIKLRALGITPAYRTEMADAGFANLSNDQLVQARSIGLSGDYVRQMRSMGFSGDFHAFVEARAIGLSPGYVGGMKSAGVQASANEYQQLRAVGVTPEYVRALRAQGIANLAPRKLIQLKAVGYDPADRGRQDDAP